MHLVRTIKTIISEALLAPCVTLIYRKDLCGLYKRWKGNGLLEKRLKYIYIAIGDQPDLVVLWKLLFAPADIAPDSGAIAIKLAF